MTSAPNVRLVNAFNGEVATLSEASDWIARQDGAITLEAENARLARDNDMLREMFDGLHCRLEELQAENRELQKALAAARGERDDYRAKASANRGTGW